MYFTYLLGWSEHDRYYYGVRYKETATPASIGTTYFSSSKYVKNFIENFGAPDIVEIRKIFDDKNKAKVWEEKVLRRIGVISSERWINKSNNNSFRGIVMDQEIKNKISKSKKNKRLGTYYNDGKNNILLRENKTVPDGYVKGKIMSDKQKQHINNLNSSLTKEKRQEMGKLTSEKTKGKPKPNGFSEKISLANKGKQKPWSKGDNNVSKRDDVREKISNSIRGRKHYTDGDKLIFVRPEFVPEGFRKVSIYEYRTRKKD